MGYKIHRRIFALGADKRYREVNMSEITISNSALPRFSARYKAIKFSNAQQEIFLIGLILSLIQIVDGLLTLVGVKHFGSDIEGNPIVKNLIDSMGAVPALGLTKLFAIFVIIALCSLYRTVPWIGRALKSVMVVYLVAAIIPWSYLILSKIG